MDNASLKIPRYPPPTPPNPTQPKEMFQPICLLQKQGWYHRYEIVSTHEAATALRGNFFQNFIVRVERIVGIKLCCPVWKLQSIETTYLIFMCQTMCQLHSIVATPCNLFYKGWDNCKHESVSSHMKDMALRENPLQCFDHPMWNLHPIGGCEGWYHWRSENVSFHVAAMAHMGN